MGKKELHVVCATDDNYSSYCSVMLCSLFENNRANELCVHVLTESLAIDSKKMIENVGLKYEQKIVFHNVDVEKIKHVKFRKKNPLSYAAFYRILLASIMPDDIDRVLYLDCDLLVLHSIRDLFNIDMADYALAAVRDQEHLPVNEEHRLQLNFSYKQAYFCSGVMLVNLEYWRQNEVESKLIEFSERERFVYFHDQDALNYLFANKWFELSPKWNRFNLVAYDKTLFNSYKEECEYIGSPSIVHFASAAKPWLRVHFINWGRIYAKYYKICFGKKMERQTSNQKFLIYKRIAEINMLNFIYHLPPSLSMIIISILNGFKLLFALLLRKDRSLLHFFSNKNIRG